MGSEQEGFKALDEKTMIEYVKATPALMARLGNQLEGLKIKEIGDGNLNFVYTVIGNNESFVIKQGRFRFKWVTSPDEDSPDESEVDERIVQEIVLKYIDGSWRDHKHIIYRKLKKANTPEEIAEAKPQNWSQDYWDAMLQHYNGEQYLSRSQRGQIAQAYCEDHYRGGGKGASERGYEMYQAGGHWPDRSVIYDQLFVRDDTTEASQEARERSALPYLRCVGESWPLTKERAYFEALALKEHGRLCPDLVPEVYHIDRPMSLTAMRYIEPPHIVLRKGLFAGIEYPLLAEHMSDYLAKTFYFTSPLFCSTLEHKRSVATFRGNIELRRHIEKITFSDPYKASEHNRWTSPYLDNDAEAVRQDDNLKFEAAELKSKFCESAQVLVHGDLHTGSVMVTADSTQIIDLEFAFYGPMGFDIGTFIGNLILAFFAQDAHANQEDDRKKYKQWILRIIEETWNLFEKKFVSLWNEHKDGNGVAYLCAPYDTPELQILAQKKYMKDLFHDTLGFGAVNMIRGILSVAHVDDLEWITDASKRACCERHALNLAKILPKERRQFESIGQVISAIQDISSV